MVNSIYDEVNEDSSIKQGDIFLNLPFVLIKDSKLSTFENDLKGVEIDLGKYTYKELKDTNILVNMRVLPGIIISQNCDILRNNCLSFCAIRPLEEVDATYKNGISQKRDLDKKKIDYFTKKYKSQEKYFYLPNDNRSIFLKKMAVDFSTIFQIKTEVIKQLIKGRRLTLNNIALLHFRQKISNYFMRFVYDPWYPLNREEFEAYLNNSVNDSERDITEPYDWQE